MTRQEEIREGAVSLFTDEIILSFWTHEHCPPNKDLVTCLEQSGWDRTQMPLDEARGKVKHPPCMDCWKGWVSELVNKVLATLHSQGVVIKSKNQKVSITFGGLLKDYKDIRRVEPLIEEANGNRNSK